MPRRKTANDPVSALSGGIISQRSHGGREDGAVVMETVLPLPIDRTLEIRWDVGDDLSALPDVAGARVKPVVFVREEDAAALDLVDLRNRILGAGAVYCRAPIVHVVRSEVKRDARHAADVPLEESLRIFAEETRPEDAGAKVEFAAGLAREADAGEEE